MGDFDYRILDDHAHRPWPMPREPWIMTQTWHDLLFAHWRVDRAALATRVPAGLELDLFDGEAWVGVVPFRMTNVGPRFVPGLPGLRAFPELNVRTYVRFGGTPGVYFFSLDASSRMAVHAARRLFRLPYYHAAMRVADVYGSIEYSSRRRDPLGVAATFAARYQASGPMFIAAAGTREYFLTARYRLYTTHPRGDVLHVDIHHPPWALQQGVADFQNNTMLAASGLSTDSQVPLLHFARRQDVVTWRLQRSRPGS